MTDNVIVYGHVRTGNENPYRKYRDISRDFEDLGDKLGAPNSADANVCYALALKYRKKANQMRVIISDGLGKDYDQRLTIPDLRQLKTGDRLQMWDPVGKDVLHGTVEDGEDGYLNLTITNQNTDDVTALNFNLKNLILDETANTYKIRHFNPTFDPEAKNV